MTEAELVLQATGIALKEEREAVNARIDQFKPGTQRIESIFPAPEVHAHNVVNVPAPVVNVQPANPTTLVENRTDVAAPDMAPIAAALDRMTEGFNTFAKVIGKLIETLSQQVAPQVKADVDMAPVAAAIEAMTAAVTERKPRKITITTDGNKTTGEIK